MTHPNEHSSDIARRDHAVEFIVANLAAVGPVGFAPAMFRAFNALRVQSLLPGQKRLSERQGARLIDALNRAYRTVWPAIGEAFRAELLMAANAAATLVLIWRGDDPKWTAGSAAAIDASDLVLSYEFEMLSTVVFEAVASRNAANQQARDEIFRSLLATATLET